MSHITGVDVSQEDKQLLSQYRWYITPHGYVSRNYKIKGKIHNVYLHNEIMGKNNGLVIDHINGNKLDNRRENLRFLTPLENSHNSTKTRATSGYRGVSWSQKDKKFVSRVYVMGKKYVAGYFDSAEEASIAYYEKKANILEGVL